MQGPTTPPADGGAARADARGSLDDSAGDARPAPPLAYAFAAAHPGSIPWIVGFLAAFGFILASYVTKEFTIRTGPPYPNDVFNRLKRRDLRILLICIGAVVGRPFEALTSAGALSHVCVIGILIKGWVRTRTTKAGETTPTNSTTGR